MKYIFLIIVFILVSCNRKEDNSSVSTTIINIPLSADESKEVKLPKIEFEETTYNFGTLLQGEKIKHKFKFKNTGERDLIVYKAKGYCGCTVSEFPKQAISPGQSGEVLVEYNSAGYSGMQTNRISVLTNTKPPQTTLTINAMVLEP